MSRIIFRNNFTGGIVDERMAHRTDVAKVANGLKKIDNGLVNSYGQIVQTRRHLWEQSVVVPNIANTKQIIEMGQNSDGQRFILAIYRDVNDYKVVSLKVDDSTLMPAKSVVKEIVSLSDDDPDILFNYAYENDTVILFNEGVEPKKVVLDKLTNTLTVSAFTPRVMPRLNYGDSGVGANASNVLVWSFAGGSVGDDDYWDVSWRGETVFQLRKGMTFSEIKKQMKAGMAKIANTEENDFFITSNISDNEAWQDESVVLWRRIRVEFQNEMGNQPQQNFLLNPYNTTLQIRTEIQNEGKFPTVDAWYTGSGTDHDHGFPTCGAFHQGRLYIGGFPDAPQTVVASAPSDFENFNFHSDEFSFGFRVTIGGQVDGRISQIIGGRRLAILTNSEEYVAESPDEKALSPKNFALKKVGDSGCNDGPYGRPVEYGGAVFFPKGDRILIIRDEPSPNEFVVSDVCSDEFSGWNVRRMVLHRNSRGEGYLVVHLRKVGHDEKLMAFRYDPEQETMAWSVMMASGFDNSNILIAASGIDGTMDLVQIYDHDNPNFHGYVIYARFNEGDDGWRELTVKTHEMSLPERRVMKRIGRAAVFYQGGGTVTVNGLTGGDGPTGGKVYNGLDQYTTAITIQASRDEIHTIQAIELSVSGIRGEEEDGG